MIVCVCRAVSDRRIQAIVRDGASSLDEVQFETGCGTCCGQCLPMVRQLLGGDPSGTRVINVVEATTNV